MRVLAVGTVYPPHHLGGYEVIWAGAMRHAREQGHAIEILTTDYRRADVDPGADRDPTVHRELDWYWRDHEWRKLGPRQRLALERRNAATFDRHLTRFRPDVITWWPIGGLSLSLLERARRAGMPSVLFVLDPWPAYGPDHDLWLRMWKHLRPLRSAAARITGLPTAVDLAAAGRYVFCSASIREGVAAAGLRTDDATIITPGVATAYLSLAREPAPEPRPWRWRLLYVGRVVEQKGVVTAIEALAHLPEQATLRIVGDGDEGYRRSLHGTAAALGVADRVTFEPARGHMELPVVYRDADAVVFPVRWREPWGLVPLEAMALGTPVLATGLGGSGDYLVDGTNALLFGAGDATALAARVRELAAEPELRERLRRAGYETAALHSEDAFNRRALAEIEAVAAYPHAR